VSFVVKTEAQSVLYGYDASGNRTSRTIVMKMLSPPPQDSTETIIEEEIIAGTGQNVVQNTEDGNEKTQEIYTDILAGTQISIYPNPTGGKLQVTSYELRVESIEIFDMMGRCMWSQYSVLNTQYSIDISHLPAGTYIMRIAAGNEVVNWKVVKQ
jgi:hypothetical protein